MTWLPFICLGIGSLIGFSKWVDKIIKLVDPIINVGLVVLMLTLGAKIGSNDSLIHSLGLLGFRCLFTAATAIAFSVLFTVLLEKTVLSLGSVQSQLACENIAVTQEVNIEEEEKKPTSPLVWIIPVCIILGIVIGYLVPLFKKSFMLDHTLTISLVILYIGVGISFGMHKNILQYVRILGFKIILIPTTIIIGSLVGGFVSGILLGMPTYITVSAAGGMSYYSITGAYLTQKFGIEVGAYGFLVNVSREFLTVLFLPLLIKVSKGSPIASGAAGNMDTMLVPVTKFVGVELGLVALITGTILTFLVPFMLPLLVNLGNLM
ncbi:lysine exporter LysO family protein [Inediibacterium massiliense]|uniref:lysine exporter LysO family protein n=1 Tax=Inediibacterium massiliense TaxID=1658111 RepID=UPI0006B5132E|nr:lysine exporter LysO family protein [Inediibacterium massiliense]